MWCNCGAVVVKQNEEGKPLVGCGDNGEKDDNIDNGQNDKEETVDESLETTRKPEKQDSYETIEINDKDSGEKKGCVGEEREIDCQRISISCKEKRCTAKCANGRQVGDRKNAGVTK